MEPALRKTDVVAAVRRTLSPLRVAALYVFACLIVLQLARVANLWTLREALRSTAATAIAHSWLVGLRYDVAATSLFVGLPVFMLALPRPERWQGAWQRTWHGMACLGLVFIAVASIADHYFLAEVNRHVGQEIMTVAHDLDFLVAYAAGPAAWGLLALAAAVALAVWTSVSLGRRAPARVSAGGALLVLLLVAVAARGSLGNKPINAIDAFNAGSYELAQLELNGAFSMAKAIGNAPPKIGKHDFESALGQLGYMPGDLPFAREAGGGPRHNVVVFLLESWSAKYVDAFSDGKPLGVTPNMDRLAREGVAFTNFYSSGQRSFEGVQAVLTGLPSLPGMQTLTEGLTLRVPRIGTLAASQGMRTIFTQSAARRSLRLDSVARSLGFAEYYGREDNARVLLDYPDAEAFRFGLDHETMQGLADRLHGESRPFLAFLFTGSTHAPYAPVPPALQSEYPSRNPEKGLLDVIHYADWSIGQFMERARHEPWFDNTVFIFTADHTQGARGPYQQLRDRFHIPMVIYAPGLFDPRVDTRVASHVDIFDTVVELIGAQTRYASTGHSLLDAGQRDRALIRSGENLGLVTADRCFMYTPDASAGDADARYLAAYRSALYGAIQRETWFQ
jgi:phosphoglycerol transferase MdoB-like AlkP superfamily enzyme